MPAGRRGRHPARMDLDIAPVGDRLELYAELDGGWPEFMTKDPAGAFYYRYSDRFWPEFALLAVDRDTGRAVSRAHSVPLAYDGDITEGLPEGGWDWMCRTALHDRLGGVEPTMVSALKINIRSDLRGSGLSGLMLTAMRDNAARHGFIDLVAPVRLSGNPTRSTNPSGSTPTRPAPTACRSTRGCGCTCGPGLRS
jgi:hypothetical protein